MAIYLNCEKDNSKELLPTSWNQGPEVYSGITRA